MHRTQSLVKLSLGLPLRYYTEKIVTIANRLCVRRKLSKSVFDSCSINLPDCELQYLQHLQVTYDLEEMRQTAPFVVDLEVTR